MTLYLYDSGTKKVLLTMEKVVSYTETRVITEEAVYGPFAEGCELSSLPDCSETLLADWRQENPGTEERLEGLEYLMAELLFGGEAV